MGTKRCQRESRYSGLDSCWTWSVCVSVCLQNFIYACVWDYIFVYVCKTTYFCMCVILHFMHVCETTLCNIQMTLFEHPLYCNIQKSFRVHNETLIWPNLTWSNLLKWDTKWPQMKKLWITRLFISSRSTILT